MEKPIKIAAPAGAARGGSEQKRTGDDAHAHATPLGYATPPGHVTWDEETIARHDLERGTRMKIDEPNTPFHYYRGSDMEAADGRDRGDVSPARSLSGKEGQPPIEWNELETKLRDVQGGRKSEWDSSDEEDAPAGAFAERDAEGRKLVHDPKFAEKRKMHYNEFERVRAWKMQHAGDGKDDYDDEEEEAEEEEKAGAEAEGAAATLRK